MVDVQKNVGICLPVFILLRVFFTVVAILSLFWKKCLTNISQAVSVESFFLPSAVAGAWRNLAAEL